MYAYGKVLQLFPDLLIRNMDLHSFLVLICLIQQQFFVKMSFERSSETK